MRKKNAINFLLLVSSIIVSILLAEIVLQVIGKPSAVVSGWLNQKTNVKKNQLGFRGQKFHYTDDDYVIVLLGDSQVEASACSFNWLPESRLEYHLNQKANQNKNIKVFSVGAGGYGQDQQLLMLQKYYQTYRANLVVLWQTPINDVWNNVFPTHFPRNGWPKPTFRLVKSELQGPSENFGEELNWSKIKIFTLLNRLFQIIDRDGVWEKYLPEPYKPLTNYEGAICHDWQERWDNNLGLMRDENLDTEKSHFTISLTPVSPRIQYGLDLTKALLGEIKRLVNNNNGEFIVFNTEEPGEKQGICAEDEVFHLLNGKYYKTSKRQLRDNLEYLNTGFISFTLPISIPNWRVGPENRHLNERATDQVIDDLSSQILPLIK